MMLLIFFSILFIIIQCLCHLEKITLKLKEQYMKVLHAAETIKGGVATVIDSLARYQIESGKISEIKIIAPEQDKSELSEVISPNIVTFSRNKRGVAGLYAFAKCFHHQVKTFKPDVIHLHSTFAGFVGRLIIVFFFCGKNSR